MRSMLGAVLLLVAPVLLGVPAEASTAAALVAVALAAAVLLLGADGSLVALAHAPAIRPTAEGATPPAAGRVTDPVHHPIRPRAPGTP